MFRRAGRRWFRAMGWILVLTFIVTLTMGVYIKFYEPERHVAEYTLYAVPQNEKENTPAPLGMWMLIRDYNRLLDDDAFRQEVVAQTESNGKTFVSARGNSLDHMIVIRAVGPDAMIAGGLADAVGDKLVAESEERLGITTARTISRTRMLPLPGSMDDYIRLLKTMLITFGVLSLLAILFGSRREPAGWLTAPESLHMPVAGQLAECEKCCEQCARTLAANTKRKRTTACILLDQVDRLTREGAEEAALAIRAAAGGQSCSVAVTGVRAEDPAPVLAVLLGQTLARSGYSVLLLEMDGDDPQLHRYLGVTGRADVVDCLTDDSKLPAALLRTSIANLHLIDCFHGGETVRQAAASPAFRTFVQDALAIYDYVILNAPPAGFGGCAPAVGAAADQTVLVAADRRYTADELNGVDDALRQRAVRLTGVVFTGVVGKQLKKFYGSDGKPYRRQRRDAARA